MLTITIVSLNKNKNMFNKVTKMDTKCFYFYFVIMMSKRKKLPFNGKNSFQFFIGNNTTKRKENQF